MAARSGTAIEIASLPRIVEVLGAGGTAGFVVLEYAEFVALAAMAATVPPDVVAVLDHGSEHVFVVLAMQSFTIYINALNVAGTVDEQHYLAKHPDVKAAVDAGHLPNGTHHYIIAGYFERRAVRWPGPLQRRRGQASFPVIEQPRPSAAFPDIP